MARGRRYLPDRQIDSDYRNSCQAPCEKIFLFYRNENQSISITIPPQSEGHCARSPVRGGDAVDADALVTRALEADGEVVWS